jgi:hypothetical protein
MKRMHLLKTSSLGGQMLVFLSILLVMAGCKTCNCPAYSYKPPSKPPSDLQIKNQVNEPFKQVICYQIFTVQGQMKIQTEKI